MTIFLWFFFMENLTESEFVPMMMLVAVVASVTNGLIWNIGVPALFMRLTKPVGRLTFYRNILIYTLIIAALGICNAYCCYDYAVKQYEYYYEALEVLKLIYIAETVCTPLIFGIIACAALANTKLVDRKPPARFLAVRPVKAMVIETDPVTAVEYEGKRYALSKRFYVRLRDKIKVRIKEDEEKGYLK